MRYVACLVLLTVLPELSLQVSFLARKASHSPYDSEPVSEYEGPDMIPIFPKGRVPAPHPNNDDASLRKALADQKIMDGTKCKLFFPKGDIFSVQVPALKPFLLSTTFGPAIVIAPGGGDRFLAWWREGIDVAKWLNSLGLNAFVLKYRVPGSGAAGEQMVLQDSQRAMSLIRSRAQEWGIDPSRIGFMGFSFGGKALAALTAAERRLYIPMDEADRLEYKPNLAFFVYGSGDSYHHISNPPPSFSVSAWGDMCSNVGEATAYCDKIRSTGQECKRIVYPNGGHGFGTCSLFYNEWSGPAACDWTNAASEFMVGHNFLQPPLPAKVVIAQPRPGWDKMVGSDLSSVYGYWGWNWLAK